jgi:integrase
VAPEKVRVAMDLALITGLRRGYLLSLTRSQLKNEGIHVQTSKTGRKLIIECNDELREAIHVQRSAFEIGQRYRRRTGSQRAARPFER